VKPELTSGGYVFPVWGPSSFSDDFGAPRADVAWHHGNDIFAPLGAPVLAVADGTVFLVGWNDLGGNRFWLRDRHGNEFYYAHLSAYSPLAVNGAHVRAGDVIGFVGNTGDAVGTPTHLHFEIHPVGLLGLGYDGVVDPYPFLLAWKRLADAPFASSGWPGRAGPAPKPGAVLLEADDISATSGLDAEALAGVLAMPPLFGEGRTTVRQRVVGAAVGFGK
jgi:murein DD-endopeptidase MepM/ murein hydrolase activator NlpD